jgi:HK97 family phage portal protein
MFNSILSRFRHPVQKEQRIQPMLMNLTGYSDKIRAPLTFYLKDFLELYGEGDLASVYVFACIHRKAMDGAQVPLQLMQQQKDGTSAPVEDHELLDLFRDVNPRMHHLGYRQLTRTYYELAGNVFIGLEELRGTKPQELWPIRPDIMSILPDNQGNIRGYIADYGQHQEAYTLEEMVHWKFPALLNAYWGMPPLAAARKGIVTNYYRDTWNENFFLHGMKPSGILMSKRQLSDDERDDLKDELLEQYQDYKKAHAPLLLEGELFEWVQLSTNPKDAEFSGLRTEVKQEIYAATGVPPVLVMDMEGASKVLQNTDVQVRLYWKNTQIPALLDECNFYNEFLVPIFDNTGRLFLRPDLSAIDELKEDEKIKAETGKILVDSGIWTRNEVREEFWSKAPLPWGDVWWKPIALVPVSDSSSPPITETFAEVAPRAMLKAAGEIGDDVLWELKMNQTEGIEKQFSFSLEKFFRQEEADLIAILEGRKAEDDLFRDDGRLINQIEEDAIKLLKLGQPYVSASAIAGLKESFLGVLDDIELDPDSPAILRHIRQQSFEYAKNVTATTKRKLKAQLTQAIDENETIAQVAARIRGLIGEQAKARSFVIARTETNGSYNFGTHEGMQQNKELLESHKWIISGDGNERDTHQAMVGQAAIKPIGEPFEVGGCWLRYPGDQQSGCPQETINCRCVERPVVKRELLE